MTLVLLLQIRSTGAPAGLAKVSRPVLRSYVQLHFLKIYSGVQAGRALFPVMVDYSMQTLKFTSNTPTESKVNTEIQTGVVEMGTLPDLVSTPAVCLSAVCSLLFLKFMVDVGVQTDLTPAFPPALIINKEVQTNGVTGSISTILPPAVSADVDIRTENLTIKPMVDTKVTSTPALPLAVSTGVKIEDFTRTSAKAAAVDNGTDRDLPLESTSTCGFASTTPRVKAIGTENLALGTATANIDMANGGIQTNIPTESTPVATVNDDSQIKDPTREPGVDGSMQANIVKSTNTCTPPPGVPTNVDPQTGSASMSIAKPFPVTVTLRLTARSITVVAAPEGSASHAVSILALHASSSY